MAWDDVTTERRKFACAGPQSVAASAPWTSKPGKNEQHKGRRGHQQSKHGPPTITAQKGVLCPPLGWRVLRKSRSNTRGPSTTIKAAKVVLSAHLLESRSLAVRRKPPKHLQGSHKEQPLPLGGAGPFITVLRGPPCRTPLGGLPKAFSR